MRQKLFSVNLKDCRVETMRSSKGAGGQHRDKTSNAVRITHEPSGAVGFSQDDRKMPTNKKVAFKRMVESKEFQQWCRIQASGMRPIDEVVDEQMREENLKVEYRDTGKWEVA